MYILSVEKMISSAHQLYKYDGPCAKIHGHNWKIKVIVESESLQESGIALDFGNLGQLLLQIVEPFDHQLINTIPPFDKVNPTAENIVKYIYDRMKAILPNHVSLKKVSIWETENYSVSYEE
jgi:6-pyruvoyltetrahydropterin/6-carboxytetrahydropterin synthase